MRLPLASRGGDQRPTRLSLRTNVDHLAAVGSTRYASGLPDRRPSRCSPGLGLLALAFYATHAGRHVLVTREYPSSRTIRLLSSAARDPTAASGQRTAPAK
jgi:hypothetical protein